MRNWKSAVRCAICLAIVLIDQTARASEERVLDKYRSGVGLSDIRMTLSRGDRHKCLYVIIVSGGGEVDYRLYDGAEKGRREAGHIDTEAAMGLIESFLAAKFFELPDYRRTYELARMDVYSVTSDSKTGQSTTTVTPAFYIRSRVKGINEVRLEFRIKDDEKSVRFEAGKHKELDDLAQDIVDAVHLEDHIKCTP